MEQGKKVKIYIELVEDTPIVPDWVETEEELEKFVDEYIDLNMSRGYEVEDNE